MIFVLHISRLDLNISLRCAKMFFPIKFRYRDSHSDYMKLFQNAQEICEVNTNFTAKYYNDTFVQATLLKM